MKEDKIRKIEIKKAIGKTIRFYRKRIGLSGKQLADLLRISQQQVSRYELGFSSVDVYTLITIAELCDTSFINLLNHMIDVAGNNNSIKEGKIF
ncbi:helix-turn-helix domain-containing protein [Morganella morganii]|uniref:helix-turn-helix domain-containing protein n=1 Tax=Morganella morganii TaxID=582 RepID=UPI000469BBDE|nr:helix-turn-helix transcriptional regulator [Morganella morganii]